MLRRARPLVPSPIPAAAVVIALVGALAVSACSAESDSASIPAGPRGTAAAGHTGAPASQQPSHSAAPDPVSPSATDRPEAPGAACLTPADHATLVHFGPHQELGGFVIGEGGRFVVLAHQSGGSACQMLPLARRLAGAGYRAFAFDSSGTSSSAAAGFTGRQVSDDVLAAVAWSRSHAARTVSLVGASKGGYGVLDAAMRADPPVAAVVSLSAPSAWDDPRGRPLTITGMPSPVQLWASRQDPGILQAARRFAGQDPRAELHLEPGAAHGVELVPVAFSSIRDFLAAHPR